MAGVLSPRARSGDLLRDLTVVSELSAERDLPLERVVLTALNLFSLSFFSISVDWLRPDFWVVVGSGCF